MNREPLRRAILAGSITLLLLATGIVVSRSALGAQTQSQRPEKYLPLIIGKSLSPTEQTASAQAAAAATATAAAAAGTSVATATPTATATTTNTSVTTATPTATATTTNTSVATATLSPTSDAQATIQLHIVNATGWPLTFTLAGPTNASGSIEANQSSNLNIRPGHYTITAQTHCQTVPVEFDTVPDVPNDITYTCP